MERIWQTAWQVNLHWARYFNTKPNSGQCPRFRIRWKDRLYFQGVSWKCLSGRGWMQVYSSKQHSLFNSPTYWLFWRDRLSIYGLWSSLSGYLCLFHHQTNPYGVKVLVVLTKPSLVKALSSFQTWSKYACGWKKAWEGTSSPLQVHFVHYIAGTCHQSIGTLNVILAESSSLDIQDIHPCKWKYSLKEILSNYEVDRPRIIVFLRPAVTLTTNGLAGCTAMLQVESVSCWQTNNMMPLLSV